MKWNVVVSLGLVASPSLLATDLSVLPSVQIDIDQQQKERLEELDKARESLKTLVPLPSEITPEPVDETNCFDVSEIRMIGNRSTPKKEKQPRWSYQVKQSNYISLTSQKNVHI